MTFEFEGRKIYCESHGQGPPLLALNGIMMSTASWTPFIAPFTRSGHRLLLLDLMDQGRSADNEEGYTMADQGRMVLAMLDHLAIDSAALLGTSYGGALALQVACDQPRRVNRLLLSATRCCTDHLFRGMCEGWLHASHDPKAFYTSTIPLFYGASFQEEKAAWMAQRRKTLEATAFASPAFQARFRRLTSSIMDFDLRDRLRLINCPTLIISADEDLVMMPWEQERIAQGIPGAQLVSMRKTGHVMILERPELFASLAMGWFDYSDPIAGI